MADATDYLHVELVAADRTVWSGEAEMVIARTTEGDVGILHGHAPLLSLLTNAVVEIASVDHGVVIAAVDGGFLSVADNRVSVLSQEALLPEEIDVNEAKVELEEARSMLGVNDDADRRLRHAETKIRAVEKAS